jgi:hypothetical protein
MVAVSSVPYATPRSYIGKTDVWNKWSKPDRYTCGTYTNKSAVVYYIPASDTARTIAVNTCGSGFGTELIVYSGDFNNPTYMTCLNFVPAMCDAQGPLNALNFPDIVAVAGVAYYVAVRNHNAFNCELDKYCRNGAYALNIAERALP